jgi:hypothetical protein
MTDKERLELYVKAYKETPPAPKKPSKPAPGKGK